MFTKNGVNEDIKRTLSMVEERRKAIDNSPATELPKTYAVNELAKSLHPGFTKAVISDIKECTYNTKVITFKANKFPFFRAGQYVTVSMKVNGKVVTRPYSIFSSPNEAMNGVLKIAVQEAGYFSSFINKEAKIGDKVLISEPIGDFHHDSIRDRKTIFAIAGGSGITPFYSMIQAIKEGSEDFNLVILYGVKTQKDLMIEINSINDNHIKIVPIFSNEEVTNAEHGFITSELIKKYLPENSSIFMCGNNLMYKFVNKEIEKLGISLNSVRSEHNCTPSRLMDNPRSFNLTIHLRGEKHNIKAREDETILIAMEREGLAVPSRCRSGFCGFCHSRLIKGEYLAIKENEHRRLADLKFNYIHPCSTYPLSDMEIDVPIIDKFKEL